MDGKRSNQRQKQTEREVTSMEFDAEFEKKIARLPLSRQELARSFVSALSENKLPWEKAWYSNPNHLRNGYKGNFYHGVNALNLFLTSLIEGYQDRRWYTLKQINAMGKSLTKGSHGTHVEFWGMWDKENRKFYTMQEAKRLVESGKVDSKQLTPSAKCYVVFNGECVIGLEKEPTKPINENIVPHESIKKLIENMGVKYKEGGDNAYYAPSRDEVVIPPITSFKSNEGYYSTQCHELAHATGHTNRLNREGITSSDGFGGEVYAKEEFVAEITSVFFNAELGIEFDSNHLNNHRAYIQSWAKAIKDAPSYLFEAIKSSEEALEYMCDKAEISKSIENGRKEISEADRASVSDEITEAKNSKTKQVSR